jgi:signal transduction histidine kinase
MTPIVGYLKLLGDEELGAMNTAQIKALRAMDDCVRRLRSLIDNLLDVSGLETSSMRFLHRDYDFLDTTRRAIARVADRLAEQGITLVEELPRGPLPAWGDAERLSRAMSQLLDNAAKFTPSGGYVGVRVHQKQGGYELCVADTGRGISPERAGRLFEPFYQVDGSPTRQHGGVGVGPRSARIARGLGGERPLRLPSSNHGGFPFPAPRFS